MGRKSTTQTTGSLVESLDTLDPKEAKKQRRLIRNRLSAQLHRERQRSYMAGLQKQVAALTAERDLWRNAVDAMTAKASVASGMHPEELLGDLQLPVPAEQIAPAPEPPSGQISRNADGLDTMSDFMAHAQTSILPKSKAAGRSVVSAAAARALAVAADAVAALGMRPLRPSKRRSSQVSGSCSDDSDATASTSRAESTRHSSAPGVKTADYSSSATDSGPSTRRRSTRISKRPALATDPQQQLTLSRGLSYLSEDGNDIFVGVESTAQSAGNMLTNNTECQPAASNAMPIAPSALPLAMPIAPSALPLVPDDGFALSFNGIDQGDVADDDDDDDDVDSVLLTPHAVHCTQPLVPATNLAPPVSSQTFTSSDTDPVTALLIDELEDVDDVASIPLPYAAACSSAASSLPAVTAFGPTQTQLAASLDWHQA